MRSGSGGIRQNEMGDRGQMNEYTDKAVIEAILFTMGGSVEPEQIAKAMEKDVDEGFIEVLKENRKYYNEKNFFVNTPLQLECFKYYLK